MLIFTLLLVSLALASNAQRVKDLSVDQFHSFTGGKGVKIVYFYIADLGTGAGHQEQKLEHGQLGANWVWARTSADKRQDKFLNVFDQSAQLVSAYDVELGKFACEADAPSELDPYCDRIDVSYYVHCFRDGQMIYEWPVETMFDIDSAVSYILQAVLEPEIPTVNLDARRAAEQEFRGKENFLLGYQRSVGYGHRVFLEVAYAHQGKARFATTKDYNAVLDLPGFDTFDDAAVWMYFCKEAKGRHPCQVVKYLDGMDLRSLTRLVSVLDLPATHDVPDQGEFNPFDGRDLHTAVAFYDSESAEYVRNKAVEVAAQLRGLLGILLVNVDETDGKAYGLKGNEKLPALGLKIRGSNTLKFMASDQTDIEFLITELGPLVKGLTDKLLDQFGEGYLRKYDDYDDRSYDPYVQREDSPVVGKETRLPKLASIDRSNVLELTHGTFFDQTAKSDLLLVLFYIYTDARSASAFRSYVDAANILAQEGLHPLAAVECYDHSEICKQNRAFAFPVIRVYKKGQDYVEYPGLFGTDPLLSATKLYMADAPVLISSQNEADRFAAGQLPAQIASVTDTAVLGLFGDEQGAEISSFKQAAKQSWGTLLYGMATGKLATQIASQYGTQTPSVVVYRHNDKYQPYSSSKVGPDASNIVEYAMQAARPLLPELKTTNFQYYLGLEKPLVILFTDQTDSDLHDTLGSLVKDSRFPAATLAWMNTKEAGSVGAEILKEYDTTAALPVLAVISHQKNTLHVKDEVTSSGASSWIDDVLSGKLLPKKQLNAHRWQHRNPGYNFLRFVDDFFVKKAAAQQPGSPAPAQPKEPRESSGKPDPAMVEEEELRQKLLKMRVSGQRHEEL